jgi:hypothetical protein
MALSLATLVTEASGVTLITTWHCPWLFIGLPDNNWNVPVHHCDLHHIVVSIRVARARPNDNDDRHRDLPQFNLARAWACWLSDWGMSVIGSL